MNDHAAKQQSLGGIALLRNEGNPNYALAELMTQVIGMCGFIGKMGAPKDKVLECYDAMVVSSRAALVDILEEMEG